jgi:hypothetical protein
MYRIVVYRCPKDESETNHINIYEGVHGNKMIDYINTEKYTPVFQKIVKTTNDASHVPRPLPPRTDLRLPLPAGAVPFDRCNADLIASEGAANEADEPAARRDEVYGRVARRRPCQSIPIEVRWHERKGLRPHPKP